MDTTLTTGTTRGFLQITVADHAANEFRVLGGAGFTSMRETRRRFREVPAAEGSDPATDDHTILLDLLDRNLDILDDKYITQETAEALLGEPLLLEGTPDAD